MRSRMARNDNKNVSICIYCGSSNLTREHLYGKWSRRYSLLKTDRVRHIIGRPASDQSINSSQVYTITSDKPGSKRSKQIKIVCRSCNGGFLKKIVDDAIPVIRPMIHGYWGNPDIDNLKKLSNWMIMFTISNEYLDPSTVVIPQEERYRFRKENSSNENWMIAIGNCIPMDGSEPSVHRSMYYENDKGENEYFQITVAAFGNIIFTTLYASITSYNDLELKNYFKDTVKNMGFSLISPFEDDRLIRPHRSHFEHDVHSIMDEFSMRLQAYQHRVARQI